MQGFFLFLSEKNHVERGGSRLREHHGRSCLSVVGTPSEGLYIAFTRSKEFARITMLARTKNCLDLTR